MDFFHEQKLVSFSTTPNSELTVKTYFLFKHMIVLNSENATTCVPLSPARYPLQGFDVDSRIGKQFEKTTEKKVILPSE